LHSLQINTFSASAANGFSHSAQNRAKYLLNGCTLLSSRRLTVASILQRIEHHLVRDPFSMLWPPGTLWNALPQCSQLKLNFDRWRRASIAPANVLVPFFILLASVLNTRTASRHALPQYVRLRSDENVQ